MCHLAKPKATAISRLNIGAADQPQGAGADEG
jgi:hypothetical protein